MKVAIMRSRIRQNLISYVLAGFVLAGADQVFAAEELEPYKMVRSLQFVQDSIVRGDHSAGEMQRFLLKTLDQRLRSAAPEIFRDPRNVDAVVILAMSGGNPQTLEYLASRDVAGDFDNRLTRMLRRYLRGQGATVLPSLDPLVKEYSGSEVGPYLALVAGNIAVASNPKKSLDYFDQVRLLSPGTNLEEAALRRAMVIALQTSDFARAASLAGKYVRRFIYSPYASQFADVFVQMAVDGDEKLGRDTWTDLVGLMDQERAKEMYLRIARRAVVSGKDGLARDAAEAAAKLQSDAPANQDDAVGRLYNDLANVPTSNVLEAAKSLSNIPDNALSERDRNLRDAARHMAEQILMSPASQLPSDPAPQTVVPGKGAGRLPPDQIVTGADTPVGKGESGGATGVDPGLRDYVDQNRMKLQQIDDLLKKGGQR